MESDERQGMGVIGPCPGWSIQHNADAVIAVRILSLNQNKIRFLGTAQA